MRRSPIFSLGPSTRNGIIVALALLPLLLTGLLLLPALALVLVATLAAVPALRRRHLPWSAAGLVYSCVGILFLVSVWVYPLAVLAVVGVICGIVDRRAGRSRRLATWSIAIGSVALAGAAVLTAVLTLA